ncbi:MAG: HD-GYP domain-containing protein [Planctomycetota bacterium]
MSWSNSLGEAGPVARALAARCGMLGCGAWWAPLRDEPTALFGPTDASLGPAVKAAVIRWAKDEAPVPEAVGDGKIWLIPVIVVSRRRRNGLLIATSTEDGERSAARTFTALCAMRDDIAKLNESALAVDAFTDQLTESYEHLTMLHRIAREMNRVDEPGLFVRAAVRELSEACENGWAAAVLSPDASAVIRGEGVIGAGNVSNATNFEDASRCASQLIDGGPVPQIVNLDDSPRISARLGRQIVGSGIRLRGEDVGAVMVGRGPGSDHEATSHESQLVETVGTMLGTMLDAARLYQKQEALTLGVISAMTAAIDAKDRYTRGHSERVATLSKQLALAYGMDEKVSHQIYVAGLLHDVGKIGVPERVLLKPGALTDGEMDEIRRHPQIGHDILSPLPGLEDLLPAVLHHHERWDGRGYPHGLSGERIPLSARLMAIADTFDAMSSNRAYRPARSRQRVLEEIRTSAGTQFDPELAPLVDEIDLSVFDQLMARHKLAAIETQKAEELDAA